VPGAQQLNQRISSLIPAKTRAAVLSNAAPISQRIAGRMARPTGALASAGIGSAIGYERGGGAGAIAGGLTGLVVPEVLSSPTVQMAAARAAKNAPYVMPFLRGAALQEDRPAPPLPINLPWRNYGR
jgi:hypothetical protein